MYLTNNFVPNNQQNLNIDGKIKVFSVFILVNNVSVKKSLCTYQYCNYKSQSISARTEEYGNEAHCPGNQSLSGDFLSYEPINLDRVKTERQISNP